MLKKILNLGLLALVLNNPLKAATPASPSFQRIASGTVGTDEILIKLLKGEEHRLIAVTIYADNPKYSSLSKGEIPKSVKARVGDNVESLLIQQPDLVVLASYTSPEIGQQLRNAKVNVHVQKSFGSIKDIEDNIRDLGRLVGKEQAAETMVLEMDKTMKQALAKQPKCSRPPSMIQYASSDILPGSETIIDDAADRAGYHNVLRNIKSKGWNLISNEVLVQQKPDYIIASAADAKSKEALREKMLHSAAWQKLEAVEKGRIIMVPDRLLSTVSYHVAELVGFLASELRCPPESAVKGKS